MFLVFFFVLVFFSFLILSSCSIATINVNGIETVKKKKNKKHLQKEFSRFYFKQFFLFLFGSFCLCQKIFLFDFDFVSLYSFLSMQKRKKKKRCELRMTEPPENHWRRKFIYFVKSAPLSKWKITENGMKRISGMKKKNKK